MVEREEKKKVRWWSISGFSCFGGEIGCELCGTERERKSVPKRIWSRILGRKKMVPEPIVNGVSVGEMKKRTSDETKDNNNKAQTRTVQKLLKISPNPPQISNDRSKSTVQHRASKCDHRTEPAPLHKMLDPVQTQTRTRSSHSDSLLTSPATKRPDRKSIGDLDSMKGISVVTVIVALVLLFGRGFAIVCVCAWFYIVFRLKSESTEKESKIKKKDQEIDLDSEEYKKKVVLQGFLQRDKKRPVTNI